jgi:hypothetical protein
MRLNTDLQLVLTSRMCGAILTLPLYALPLPFTVNVLYNLLKVKKQDTICCIQLKPSGKCIRIGIQLYSFRQMHNMLFSKDNPHQGP